MTNRKFFYDELTTANKHIVDASCGGTFIELEEEEAYLILENLSRNSLNYASDSSYDRNVGNFKRHGIYEIGRIDELKPKMNDIKKKLENLTQASISRKLKILKIIFIPFVIGLIILISISILISLLIIF